MFFVTLLFKMTLTVPDILRNSAHHNLITSCHCFVRSFSCDFEKVKLRFVFLLCACLNLLITCMIIDQVELHSVLLPLLIGKGVKPGLLSSWHMKVL